MNTKSLYIGILSIILFFLLGVFLVQKTTPQSSAQKKAITTTNTTAILPTDCMTLAQLSQKGTLLNQLTDSSNEAAGEQIKLTSNWNEPSTNWLIEKNGETATGGMKNDILSVWEPVYCRPVVLGTFPAPQPQPGNKTICSTIANFSQYGNLLAVLYDKRGLPAGLQIQITKQFSPLSKDWLMEIYGRTSTQAYPDQIATLWAPSNCIPLAIK